MDNDNWYQIYNLTPEDRKAVALALFLAGYTVRQRKKKNSNKTVIYIEYWKSGDNA